VIVVRKIVLILVGLILLDGIHGYAWWHKKETEEEVIDTTGRVIDSARVFSEMENVKSFKNMLLFKIYDKKHTGFVCRMDDDGKNLKKLVQFDRYQYKKAGGIRVRRCFDADYYWTTNGKIVIAIYSSSDWNEDGRYKATGWGPAGKYYMANWDGSGLREIPHELYSNYKYDYKIGKDTYDDL
jgi:hypothetical protein